MPGRNRVIVILSALAASLFGSQVLAQEQVQDEIVNINDYRIQSTIEEKVPAKKIASTISGADQAHKKKSGSALLAAPRAVGGIISGITVGVPMRIARDISFESKRMSDQITDDMAGSERPDFIARTIGSCTGVAYGLFSGVIKGSIKGTERALEWGSRKPFSQESMSLKDSEQKPEQ